MNYARTGNWSCGKIPGSTDDVIFDPAFPNFGSNTACTLNQAVTVKTITFGSTYTATVTSGGSANSITLSGAWTQNKGGFVSAGETIDITGAVTVAGGTFTASSGTIAARAGLSVSGGTFTAGAGAISVTGTLSVGGGTFTGSSGTVTTTNLSITSGAFTAPTSTLTVSGTFTHSGGSFANNGGTAYFSGTSTLSHTFGGAVFNDVQIGLGTSGLVGYWKLDETSGTSAADSSTSGNTGTYSATGVSRTTGVSSTISFSDPEAVTLNGSSGYISLGTTNFPANNSPQSISLWFKGTPDTNNHNMLAMANLSTGSAVQLGYRGANLVVWSYGGTAMVSTTAPTDGAWHQVVYTYDGATDSLYVDGALASSSTTAVHQTGAPTVAYLGTYDGASELWNGSLDDVRVYSRTLTSGEIGLLAGGSSVSVVAGTHTFSDAFSCSGDFSILAGTVQGSSTFSVAGSWLNAGTFSGTGQVTLTGTAATGTITSGGSVNGKFGALTINGSGGTYTLSDNLTVTGSLQISAATLAGTKTVSVGGNFTNAGTFSVSGAVTLTSTSPSATLTTGGARFSSLTINGSGGTYTLQDRLWLPGATLTLTNGTLAAGANILHVGTVSIGSGTFTPGTSTVVLDGSADTTLPFSSFSTLRIEDPTETSLAAYWKLDEATGTTIYDSSGNGHTGTLSGATRSTSSLPSAIGFDDYGSVSFNGTTSFATLAGAGLPATNAAMTISAWVNLTSTAGNQNMVALTGGGNYVQFGLRGGSWVVWPSGATTTVTGPAATTGWHHVAYTYDGSSVDTIYVDGTAYAGAFTHQAGATTAAYLGTFNGGSELLAGALDDVRIYSVALSATQIAQLVAGRYAGTGGQATYTLGANTTVSGTLVLDDGNLSANGKTLSVTGTTSPSLVNSGTYTVSSAAQSFAGGLTVNRSGALTLASSGGSVNIGSGKTLTIDGTLNASSTGATIQASSGTYTFKVGSTAAATPTVNITGLAVKNTSGGMQIGASTAASTTMTAFNNVAFSGGSGAQYLLINAKTMFLSSTGCTFDAGQTTGGTTVAVTMAGNGTSDGETRAVFGGTTCAANWATSASDTSCGTGAKSDDDANNDGVGNNPSTNGAVVQFVRAAAGDTAGSVIGFPTPAFDWNTFTYYSTYAAFHNASGGTSDVIYVRDESGNALYSWTVPTAGETITGTPQWITTGGTHYVYVATTQGHVYRLIDTATGTTSGTLSLDTGTSWATNPFNCSCTISTPLTLDTSNLYWGSTTSGKNFWTLGQSNESNPTPVAITPTVTSASLSITSVGGTSYAFMGVVGNVLKISTLAQSITATNSSLGSASVTGRIVAGYNKSGTMRIYAGDDSGTMWGLDSGSGFATANGLWSYTTPNAIKSSPYYDHDTDTLQYGTQGGTIIVLGAGTGTVLNAGYPYTPAGGAGDSITASPLYYSGVLVVGSTGGKLYFLDRNTGTGVGLIKQYYFGASESVSGIGFDVNVNRYMVTTANSSTNDGRLYYFDLVSDPTNGSF